MAGVVYAYGSLTFPRKFLHMGGERFKKKEYDIFAPPTNIWQKGSRDDVFTKNYIPRDKNGTLTSGKKFRLPLEVVPFHYILEITPILNNGSKLGAQWTAPGNIKILVDCVRVSDSITLHAFLIKFPKDAIKIRDLKTGEKLDVTNHGQSEENEDFYVIKLAKELQVGHKYEIDITYIAPVSLKRLDGLYRNQYTDYKTGQTKYLVSTQFEPYSARQAFPCFDEPGLKASFDISIGRKAHHISLSNGNLVSSVPMITVEKGWIVDTFNTTVKMSTYTVAFIVSDYSYTEADSNLFPNRPVRIYGPKAVIDRGGGEFSANVSARVLAFYENYFDVPYPMQKMDSVAVPGFPVKLYDKFRKKKPIKLLFIAGLNIYRDRYLIEIPGVTPEALRGTISSILAHELAHQWFGNLVTCDYWQNIWLNEGFATYYSYIGQNFTNPEFEPMKKLLVDANQFAFRLDSRERSSYPILLDSDHPDELAHRFFGIPYYKGAALIRMLDGILTSNTLRAGISRYLKRWAFKAAVQDDLFVALQEQAEEDGIELPNNLTVTDIMNGWTKQRGFPVIRVVTLNSSTISVIQIQNDVRVDQVKTKKLQEQPYLSWHVPISIASADEPDFSNHSPKVWLPKGVALVNMDVDTTKWLIINPDATAYFRVYYDDNIAANLRKQLNTDHSVISPLTRSQLLDDYFNFAAQGEMQISKALEFTTYFGNETEEIVWHILLNNLRRLHYFYQEHSDASERNTSRSVPAFQGLRDYLLPRLESALMKIGFEQSPEDRGAIITTRSRLLSWACRLGSQLCLDYANKLFGQWMNNTDVNPVPTDLQEFMYCYGVRAGGGKNWLFAVDQFAKATNLLQSLRLAKSLACIEDEDVLNVFMDSVIDKETLGVSKEEFLVIFESLSSNPSRRHLAIKFLRTRLPAVIRYLNGTRSVNVLFGLLTDYVHTEEELVEVQKIYSENLQQIILEDDVVDIDEHIVDIKDNIQWMAKYYQPIREWFESQTREQSHRKV
ncbi:unnamed protein product [Orchesella dallaii]|uniref:Aminopeptidase n=1 Tax=Orchesella dallaii TaxID=48710 RepID=A0ABP1QAB2_9HEXA